MYPKPVICFKLELDEPIISAVGLGRWLKCEYYVSYYEIKSCSYNLWFIWVSSIMIPFLVELYSELQLLVK